MTDPMETAEIAAFVKAVDCHSLSRAAAELGIPRATLSRRLARLEERLGARLLRRSTRSLSLTDVGESFNRHARIALDAVSSAEASVRQVDDAVRGHLRVSVPPMMPESFRVMLCTFAERYPELRLSVHFSTRLVDLRRDGYDVALRASTELEPGLIARPISREPMLGVAAPAYLSARGMPRSLRELAQHRCLMSFARGELPQSHWSSVTGKLHVDGALFSNELTLLRDAALRGLGIAYLPLMLVHEDLRSGALVPVLPNALRSESVLAVVYPERQFVPPAVRAFVDAVVEWAPNALAQEIPGECRSKWAEYGREHATPRRSGKRRRKAVTRAKANRQDAKAAE
jgi:DNA-binding transcriptional LysR family regulator